MCIVMGADTATIPSLRQAPDVNCKLMRKYTTILLLIFSTPIFCQSIDKETFINQVYQKLVDTSFPYYLLAEHAYKLNSNNLIFIRKIPDSIKIEMEQNYLRDTLSHFWKYEQLEKAKRVEKDSIGIITGSTLRIYSLNSWSKRRKKREEKKQLDAQYENRERMPIYDKRVYFFSNPVFDNKQQFAIIHMSYGCGLTCGYGCTYLFELIEAKWTLILTGTCIAS